MFRLLCTVPSGSGRYTLSVYHRADDGGVELIILHLRSAQQLKEWDNQVNRLMGKANERTTTKVGPAGSISQVSSVKLSYDYLAHLQRMPSNPAKCNRGYRGLGYLCRRRQLDY
jgi:hypothetical protein